MSDHYDNKTPINPPPFLRSRAGWVLMAFLTIGGFYLVTGHTAHLFGTLSFAFLLACPLMHIFLHHGHGDHHAHGQEPACGSDIPNSDRQN